MNMAQHDVQENQKEEVAITSEEFISTSKKATRQIEKQNDVASTAESLEPVNSKAKSNQTHARTNDKEGRTVYQDKIQWHRGYPYFTVVPCPSADGIARRKKLGEKYFTLTFSFPNPYPASPPQYCPFPTFSIIGQD
jgi:hypothetical protein